MNIFSKKIYLKGHICNRSAKKTQGTGKIAIPIDKALKMNKLIPDVLHLQFRKQQHQNNHTYNIVWYFNDSTIGII